jgi:hypothetical protein
MTPDTLSFRPFETADLESNTVVTRETQFWGKPHTELMAIDGVIGVGTKLEDAFITIDEKFEDLASVRSRVRQILMDIGYEPHQWHFKKGSSPAVITHAIIHTKEEEPVEPIIEEKQAA